MQICVHRPDQELSGWVRGGEKNKSGCCGGLSESVGKHSGGKHDTNVYTLSIYMSPVCLRQLGFLKSWWVLFWGFIGSSGSFWVNLWAVLQCCLCFDWPRKTYRGLQQTTASRGSVLSDLLCWVKLHNEPPLKRISIFSLTELCRLSLAEDSVSSVAFFFCFKSVVCQIFSIVGEIVLLLWHFAVHCVSL